MTNGRVTRLCFPARSEHLLLPRLALTGIARACRMSDETLADLKLATTEACGNAIRHAYGDEDGVVRVEFELTPTSIRVTVEDDGYGLPSLRSWEAAPHTPDGLLDGENEGGMGLSIIKAIADSVEITPSGFAERGTRVVFTKQLEGRVDDEVDTSSFPASDPPGSWAGTDDVPAR